MIRTCDKTLPTLIAHTVNIPPCCPMSGNPLSGSTLSVFYRPDGVVFPVEDLASFVDEYVGGHSTRMVRNMEEMIQDLCSRVSDVVKAPVRVRADLRIQPPFGGDVQLMRVAVRSGTAVAQQHHEHWRVSVETSGELIVAIEPEMLAGRELSEADEDAIRTAADHLLSFIGDPLWLTSDSSRHTSTPARASSGGDRFKTFLVPRETLWLGGPRREDRPRSLPPVREICRRLPRK